MHFEMFGGAVLVGMMTGWLAGIAMKGGGYGLLWDIIFGLSGSFVGSWIFQTLGAPEAGWGGTGIAAFVGAVLMITLQRKIWPAQVAHALGTVSAREAVVTMFANNRILLTFREDVLGRARVFPGLKLAEHQMRFTSACRGASGSGEIRSAAGGAWVASSLNARMNDGARRSPGRTAVKASSETPC